MNRLTPTPFVKAIVKRLKFVRETINHPNKQINQEDFGEMIGVSRNTVGRYERHETLPDIGVCDSVCTKFGISPVWLFLGVGEMTAQNGQREWEHPQSLSGSQANPNWKEMWEKQQIELAELNAENRKLNTKIREIYEAKDKLWQTVVTLTEKVNAMGISPKSGAGGETENDMEAKAG